MILEYINTIITKFHTYMYNLKYYLLYIVLCKGNCLHLDPIFKD